MVNFFYERFEHFYDNNSKEFIALDVMVMSPAQALDPGSSCDLPVTVEYKSDRGDMERISNVLFKRNFLLKRVKSKNVLQEAE